MYSLFYFILCFYMYKIDLVIFFELFEPSFLRDYLDTSLRSRNEIYCRQLTEDKNITRFLSQIYSDSHGDKISHDTVYTIKHNQTSSW